MQLVPVGLLPCVRPQVSGEVCRSREDFPAVPRGRERTERGAGNSARNVRDAQVSQRDPRVYLHA